MASLSASALLLATSLFSLSIFAVSSLCSSWFSSSRRFPSRNISLRSRSTSELVAVAAVAAVPSATQESTPLATSAVADIAVAAPTLASLSSSLFSCIFNLCDNMKWTIQKIFLKKYILLLPGFLSRSFQSAPHCLQHLSSQGIHVFPAQVPREE